MSFTEYSQYDALGLAELVREGQISARELVTTAIEHIEADNPRLNAVVHRMYDSALAQADSDRPDGAFRGVPFLLKDLSSWYAGAPLTSGSRLFKDWIPPHDSEMVRRYKAAGVIVVGKTNTSEFGLLPFTEPELFGPTRNPWDMTRTVGGSSGGSATAVASGMVPMAGGGDGGGSLRIPASCCGIFGFKPTRGRNPTGPDQGELWHGAALEHVVSRSVRDSAAMLDALAGPDAGAPYFAPPPPRPYLEEVGAPPRRLRIAFTDHPTLGHAVHDDCKRAVADTVRLLESLGHEMREAALPVDRDAFNQAFLTVICVELATDLDEARQLLGRDVTRADVEVPTWALAMLGAQITSREYAAAARYLQRASRRIGEFFERVHVLLTPTVAAPPFPIGSLQPPAGDLRMMKTLGAMRAGKVLRAMGALERAAANVFDWIPWPPLANVTGQPAMSVPLSWNADGLPIGVQLMGRYAEEGALFRLAAQLEEAVPWRDRHPPGWS